MLIWTELWTKCVYPLPADPATFVSTNNTPATARQAVNNHNQQLPFLSRDCCSIRCIGRPDNENHYADNRGRIIIALWCPMSCLRLPDLNKETTYLLTYHLQNYNFITRKLFLIVFAVLYQVLNKQVPVPVPVPVVQVPVQVPVLNLQVPVPVPVLNLQVPVPVQVLCINYRHSVT